MAAIPVEASVPYEIFAFRPRPRRRWLDSIKMDLREIGWDVMDWIDLA
jgi:hypothetical protein